MKEQIKKHLNLILFLSGILIGVSSMLIFRKQKEITVNVPNSVTVEYMKHREDSIQKRADSILIVKDKAIERLKNQDKSIDKKLNHDKSIINYTDNIDSLSKSAIYYINHF